MQLQSLEERGMMAVVTGGTGPGGFEVANGAGTLALWLDASDVDANGAPDTASNGSTVSIWADRSGYGRGAYTFTGTPQIVTASAAGNNQPAIAFLSNVGGDDVMDTAYDFDNLGANYSIFAVSRYTTGVNARVISSKTHNWLFGQHGALDERFYAEGWIHGPGGTGTGTASIAFNVYSGMIGPAVNGNAADPGADFWKNGTQLTNDNVGSSNTVYKPGRLTLGRYGLGNSEPSTAEISEIIIINRVVNEAERRLIENALVSKYNLVEAAAQDIYAGDTLAAGDFDFDMIGVGRIDATNALLSAGRSGFGIETLAIADSGDFIAAAHKTLVNGVTSSGVPGGVSTRWSRSWYLDKTDTNNNLGANLSFDFSDANVAMDGANGFTLLRSIDGGATFTAVPVSGTTVSGDTITFGVAAADLTDAIYTIGYNTPAAGGSASIQWDGSTGVNGGDGVSWNDPNNWSGSVVPDSNDIAVFANDDADIVQVSSPTSVGSIQFTNTSGLYSINATGTGSLTLTVGNVNQLGTVSNSITAPLNSTAATIAVDVISGTNLTLSGPISGLSGLSQSNTGTLNLSGANTFAGGVTLNNGTLNINANYTGLYGTNPLGTGTLTVNGGSLNVAGTVTNNGLRGQFFDLTPSATTITNSATTTNGNFNSLQNLSSYLSPVQSALLAAPNLNLPSAVTAVNFANNAAAAFTAAGYLPADNTVTRFTGKINIATAGDTTFYLNSDDGSMMWVDGQPVVSRNAFGGFAADPGTTGTTVSLSAGDHDIVIAQYEATGSAGVVARYTPPGGSQQIIPTSVLKAVDNVLIFNNHVVWNTSTTITVNNTLGVEFGNFTQTVGTTLNTAGNGFVRFKGKTTFTGSGTVTHNVGSAVGDLIFSGQVTDQANTVNWTKTGPGQMIFENIAAGADANDIDGVISVQAGRIVGTGRVGGTTPLDTATINLDVAGVSLMHRSTNGATAAFTNTINVNANASIVNLAGIGGSGATTVLSSANSINIASGVTLTLDSLEGTQLIQSAILGAAGTTNVTKTGHGATQLDNNTNNYTGLTNLTQGTLIVSQSNALGNISGDVSTAAGTTLRLQNNIAIPAGETITLTGATLRNESGNNSIADQVIVATSSTIFSNTAGTAITLTNGLDITNGAITFDGGGNANIGLILRGANSNGLVKNGTGTFTLTNNGNNYAGTTTINAGVLEITQPGALGLASAETIVNSGGSLRLNGSMTLTEPLTLNGAGASSTGALQSSTGNNTVSSVITVAGSFSIGNNTAGTTLNVATPLNLGTGSLTATGAGDVTISQSISGQGLAPGSYSSNVLADTPINYWRLNDTTGTSAAASAGGNGTYAGAFTLNQAGPFVGDPTNKSVDFAGGTFAGSLVAGVQSKFSIEFWLNPDTRTNYNQVIGDNWGTYLFHTTVNGEIYTGNNCCGTTNRYEPPQIPANTLVTGQWHHFVYTFDNSLGANNAKFYKNGALVAQTQLTTGTAALTAMSIQNSVDGRVSELAVYNAPLSAARILAHYSASGLVSNDLIKTGTGTLTLSGNNSYNGSVTVSGGRLVAASPNALGLTAGGVRSDAGTIVEVSGNTILAAEPMTLTGELRSTGNNTLTGNIGFTGSNTITSNTAGTKLIMAGGLTRPANSNLTFAGAGDIDVNGVISSAAVTLAPFTARFFNNASQGITTDAGAANINTAAFTGSPNFTTTLGGPINFATDADQAFKALLNGGDTNIYTVVFVSTLTVNVAGAYNFASTQNDDGAVIWVDTSGDGSFQAAERVQNAGNTNTAINSLNLNPGTYTIVYAFQDTGGASADIGRFDIMMPVLPVLATSLPLANPLNSLTALNNAIFKTGTGTTTLAGNNTIPGVINVQQGTLVSANTGALGAASGDAGFLPSGSMNVLWNVGLDNGTNSDFGAEDGVNAAGPGSAAAKDNDYYFAGTYSIGNVTSAEPFANFERAVTRGDGTKRIHFNLTQGQLDDNYQLIVDTIASTFTSSNTTGNATPLEIFFNGTRIHHEVLTADKTITTLTFNGLSVGAVAGENVITIQRPTNGSDWTQFDYVRLNSQTGTVASGTVVSEGASLGFSASSNENVLAFGDGANGTGAIKNVSGTNTLSGTVTAGRVAVAPQAVTLQNVSAQYSQSGWNAANMIDGNLATGWADDNAGVTADNVAVMETATNLNPAGGLTELTFNIYTGLATSHILGKLRLSVTNDDRSTFADGLQIGGDITANWTVLTPTYAAATRSTLTIQPDGSILASGNVADFEYLTIKVQTSLANITGFRIEAITDATLPTSGPGRAANGNFVVQEVGVTSATVNRLTLGADAGELIYSNNVDLREMQLMVTGAGNTTINGSVGGYGVNQANTTYASTVLADNPRAFYQFNGNANDSATSAAQGGIAANGTVTGATFTSSTGGQTGLAGDQAASFDGAGDVITVGSVAADFTGMQTNNSATVSLWHYGVNQFRANSTIWFSDAATNRQFSSHLPWSDSNVYFDTGGGAAGGTQRINGVVAANLVRGGWNNWTFVKSGDNKYIYVNGELFLFGTNTAAIGAIVNFFIGAESAAASNSFYGVLDDLAVYDRALTPGQIRDQIATRLNSGSLTVDNSLIKNGTGTLTLAGNNTYTGTTTVNSGGIIAANNNALGSPAADTTVVTDGAWVRLANGVNVSGESITINGNGDTATTSGALQAAAGANATWGGTVNLGSTGSGPRVGALAGGTLNLTGAIQNGTASDLFVSGQSGTGKVVVSGATKTYSGSTNIVCGVLALGSANVLPSGTTLDVDNANAAEVATFDLAGNSQTVGALQRTDAGGGGNGVVTNSSATVATLTVNQAGNTTFSGNITGNLALVKDGSGILNLSAKNPYTQGTTVNLGTLRLSSTANDGTSTAGTGTVTVNPNGTILADTGDNQLGHNNPANIPNLVINGGTFTASSPWAGGMWVKGITMTGGTLNGSTGINPQNSVGSSITSLPNATPATISTKITNSMTNLVFTVGDGAATDDLLITGQITGNAISKTGLGTLTLNNNTNNYTGGTLISQGTIRSATSLSTQGTITLNDASTGANPTAWLFAGSQTPANPIVVNNQGTGTVTIGTYSAGSFTAHSGGMTLNRAVTLSDATGDRTTFTGQISGAVGLITIAGTRITFGNGTNNFVGDLLIPVGTIYQNDAAGALPDATNVTANGTFRLNNSNEAINGLNGTGTVTNIVGANTLTVGAANGGGTFSGVIVDGSGAFSLTKAGTGTQTLAPSVGGPQINYTGNTIINAGTLELVDLNNTAAKQFNSNITINSPGILEIDSSTAFATRWNYGRTISGNGTFNKTSAGVFGITGAMSMSGQINVIAGRLHNDNVTGNWSANTADVTISAGAVLDLRANDMVMDSLNGSGEIWNSHDAGGGDNLIVGVANGSGVFTGIIRGNDSQANDNPDGSFLGVIKNGTGTQTFGPSVGGPQVYYTGQTTINNGTLELIDLNNSAGRVFNSNIAINSPGILEIDSSTAFATRWNYGRTITGNGTLNKTSAGVFGITGAMSMSGQINVIAGRLHNDNVTGNWSANTADLNISAGAVLDLRANDIRIDALTGSGEIWNSHDAGGGDNLIIGVANGSFTYSGIIRGNDTQGNDNPDGSFAAVIKQGSGTAIFTGASTYSGGTTVSGTGRLLVNNVSGSGTGTGAVIVQSGATLGGTGSISGPVTVQNGGFLSPGTSPADLGTGSLTLDSSSTYIVELNGATPGDGATNYDQTVVTGAVSVAGSILQPSLATSVVPGQVFTIIRNDGADAVTGTFSNANFELAPIIIGGQPFHVSYVYNSEAVAFGGGNDVALIVNRAPVANAGGPFLIGEGSSVVLNGLGSSDPDLDALTYAWDLDGDGQFDDANGATPTVNWADLEAMSLPITDGTVVPTPHTIRLQVTDVFGATHVASGTLNTSNVGPTGATINTVSGQTVFGPGQPIAFVLTADDPASYDDFVNQWTWTINWNDGSPLQTVSGPNGTVVSHTYATVGAKTATITQVKDHEGTAGTATASRNVTISQVFIDGDGNLVVGGFAGVNDTFIITQDAFGVKVGYSTSTNTRAVNFGPYNLDADAKVIVFGQSGNDRIELRTSVQHSAELHGGDGDDKLYGANFDDQIFGDAGNDTVSGGAGNDYVDGGAGIDLVDGGIGDDSLIGGLGNDKINGLAGNDVMYGGTLDTSMVDSAGADLMDGGDGDDILFGQEGNDTLKGQRGNDALFGGLGNDTLEGSYGNDILIGGMGIDRLIGGADSDVVAGGSSSYDNPTTAGVDVIVRDLLTLWGDPSSSFSDRVDALLGAGDPLDPSSTVNNNDGVIDSILGQAGEDWFLASLTSGQVDKLDRAVGDRLN